MRRIVCLVGLVSCIILARMIIRLAARLYSRPLDVSGTMYLPRLVKIIKDRNEVAYPAHVILATILEATGGSPTAAGLQWLKAAAHARSDAELIRAARGLENAQRRCPDSGEFVIALSCYLRHGELAQHALLLGACSNHADVPPKL